MSLLGNLTVGILGNMNGLNDTFKGAKSEVKKFGDSIQKQGKAVGEFGSALTTMVTVPLLALGGTSLKFAIDFESAFAGVRKTVDATEKEFAELKQGFRDIAKEIPVAATEIANVGEAAGQLGIKKENILDFTRVMVDLGVATNMSSEEAAMALARLANITQMPQDQFDRLGSTIVDLGNNLATTESEIVAMGLRIAGAGHQIGLTEAQIMAIAGSLSSVGIEAEAGGSAISRVMINMAQSVEMGGEDLENFAKVAGMSVKDFKKLFEEDAANALVTFIEGLSKLDDESESTFMMLDKLGLSEIRVRDALLRATGAGDLFRNSLELGNKAWDENIALTNEAEERYKTTESQLIIFWNRIKDIGITLGDVLIPALLNMLDVLGPIIDIVAQAAEWFASLDPSIQGVTIAVAAVAAAIGPFLVALGMVITNVGALISSFGALGGVVGIITGPIGITVAALAGISLGAYKLTKELKETGLEFSIFGDEVSDATEEAVGSFLDLNSEATVQLDQLKWSSAKLTKETADGIVQSFSGMSDQMLEELSTSHEEQLAAMNEFYNNSKLFSEKDRDETLKAMEEKYKEQQNFVKNGESIINDILTTAAAENRQLSISESTQINNIREGWVNKGIELLTQNELESKSILERMKAESSKISAEQAADVVKNSMKQKDEAIKAAEEQYDQSVQAIIKQRDEMGTISANQASIMILDAELQRDSVVGSAESMHADVVKEAQAQANEHVNLINWETGEILSKWDVFKTSFMQKLQSLADVFAPFIETTKGAFRNLMDSLGPIFESLKTLFQSLLPILKAIGVVVGGALVVAFGLAISIFNALVSAIGPIVNAFINLVDVVVNVVNAIGSALTGDFSGAMEYWKQATESSIQFFQNLWTGVVNFFKTFIQTIIDYFLNLYMTLVGNSIVPDMVNEIVNWFRNMFSWLVGIVANIVSGVTSGFNAVKNAITTALNAAKTIISSILNYWINTFKNATAFIKAAVTGDFQGMKNAVSAQMQNILTTATRIFGAAKDAIANPVEKAKNLVGNAIEKIKGFFSGLKLKFPKIEMPKLPKFSLKGKFSLDPPGVPKIGVDWFKDGGIFAPNSPRLIGIGDAKVPEAALPLSDSVLGKIGEMIAHTMPQQVVQESTESRPIIIENILNVDGRRLARATGKYFNEEQGKAIDNRMIYGGGR